MAVRDFELFIRERALIYDSNLDVSSGAPFDVHVVQPLVRRLGSDPFSVDLSTFLSARMAQAFPDLANQEEDAVTDLLIKPATLLWDPVVREVTRVRQNLSLANPSLMTSEEADALGANFFSTRRRGQFARGPGRILFQSAQNISISPANFFTSKGGLHFFPTEIQSISAGEMILNITSEGLYYFDVNLIAESAGTQYNIGPNELMSVANVPAATRVLNVRRFTFGGTEEGAQQFISRTQQELGERSLVTLRGVAAKLVDSFPELQRLNVVGFNDPEMQRDVLRGGGLGNVMASGVAGSVTSDGQGAALSRRFTQAEVDFTTVFGASGPATGWVLTLFEAFGESPFVRDLHIRQVLNAAEVDVDEQVLVVGQNTGQLRWTVRKEELTLSGIPGGILFPNTTAGTLTLPNNEVHIGGMYDTYVRGSGLEQTSFVIEALTDDAPLLSGAGALRTTLGSDVGFSLPEYGVAPFSDELLMRFTDAALHGYTLQVQEGPNAGNYRVLGYDLTGGGELFLLVDPEPPNADVAGRRWRLFDTIDVNLLSPRETRVSGSDLSILQNSGVVSVGSGTDLNELGVAKGDVLTIAAGLSAGDYTLLEDPLSPTTLRVDTTMRSTGGSLTYTIYRPNAGGALIPPFVRLTQLELLDSSNQPLGTVIPYAKPIDAQSRAFQNAARGVKHDFRNTLLGLLTRSIISNFGNSAGATLSVYVEGLGIQVLTLTTANASLSVALSELNAEFEAQFGIPSALVLVGNDRLGFRPVGDHGYVAILDGTARTALFGDTQLRTTGDVRAILNSTEVVWGSLSPAIDTTLGLDVLQILDGFNIGFYPSPFTLGYSRAAIGWTAAIASTALIAGSLDEDDYLPSRTFSPEQNRRVQVGARSLGSARLFFLEPTSFEASADTVFSLDLGDQGVVRFTPDPTLESQQIPPLPGNDTPVDGATIVSTSTFTAVSQDFLLAGVQPGYKLHLKNHPIGGTVVLTDPVPALGGLTFIFSLGGETDRTVTFVRDDASIAALAVTLSGVVSQINDAAGEDIVEVSGTGTLRFITTQDLVVRGAGTANSTILGDVADTSPAESFGPEDQNNASPHAGIYVVASVGRDTLVMQTDGVTPAFGLIAPFTGAAVANQSFEVYRVGVQRISTTEMSMNVAEAGLYYFDVELISEGTGDLWNIEAGQQLEITGYRSDGWYLETEDPNLTFSEVERPRLVLSRSILELGVDDSPANATQLTGENLQVTYDRSELVTSVQSYLGAETERVVCANPLSRHLVPHFVRFDMTYVGGSREEIVLEDVERYIKELSPVDSLDSSDIQKFATDRGASYVKNPLDLLAIVHRVDRTVWAHRSQDRLSTGRLSAFISERVTLYRDVSGGIG